MKKRSLKRCIQVVTCVCGLFSTCMTWAGEDTTRLTLHYNRPAEYFEEALVIGNGTMGAIVYGGTERDVISLNDLTLWTGEPDRKVTSPDAYKAIPEIRRLLDAGDYRGADREQRKVQGHYSENYQPLGCLTVTYLDVPAQISAYSRSLDIANAVAETRYLRDGQPFSCDHCVAPPVGKPAGHPGIAVVRLAVASRYIGQWK